VNNFFRVDLGGRFVLKRENEKSVGGDSSTGEERVDEKPNLGLGACERKRANREVMARKRPILKGACPMGKRWRGSRRDTRARGVVDAGLRQASRGRTRPEEAFWRQVCLGF